MQWLLDSKIGPLHHLTKNLPTLIYKNDTMPEEILGAAVQVYLSLLLAQDRAIDKNRKFWRLR